MATTPSWPSPATARAVEYLRRGGNTVACHTPAASGRQRIVVGGTAAHSASKAPLPGASASALTLCPACDGSWTTLASLFLVAAEAGQVRLAASGHADPAHRPWPSQRDRHRPIAQRRHRLGAADVEDDGLLAHAHHQQVIVAVPDQGDQLAVDAEDAHRAPGLHVPDPDFVAVPPVAR